MPVVRHALLMSLLLFVADASAVVIRDDVPDLKYRMAASDFPALADLPGEGHGVLIAPDWVVTVAHAVSWQGHLDVVVVGGTPRAVRRVVIHPGYKVPPEAMVQAALASGDWEAFFEFLAASDDLALIQLAEPVGDVVPVAIHRDPGVGQLVRIMGRGATGNGVTGYPLQSRNRTDLRQGHNEIVEAGGRWLTYRFDAPPAALELEAATGSGDSGGPILVMEGDQWRLAGLAAWKRGQVVGTEIRQGRYGEISYGVRLAHYSDWMGQILAEAGDSSETASQ
ncbi:MAG: hypothetical protein ABS41_11340 [Arenimonas sp. SCN 70-307]|nr:MAG: hypothetical protein ABS41_11340 [Arenimonas sp. SCN 70-307]